MLFFESYFAALYHKLDAPGPSVPVILETTGYNGETRYAVFNYKEANIYLKHHRNQWRSVIRTPKLTVTQQEMIDDLHKRRQQEMIDDLHKRRQQQTAWIKERQEQRRNRPPARKQSYQEWLQGLRNNNRTTN